jgi:drug/metabolite transporter (DMT)-like permease
MRAHKLQAYILISLTVLFWGVSFIATKIALRQLDVPVLIFTRFILALLLFSIIFLIQKRIPHFSRAEHGKIFVMSFLEPVLYFYFETQGLKLTSAPSASLLIATIPVFVMIISFFTLKEKITVSRISGIILSIAGTVVLILGATGFSWCFNDSMKGDFFILGAVVSASLYTVLMRGLSQRHSAMDLTMMQIVYGTFFFFILSIPHLHTLRPIDLSAGSICAIIYLAVFCTILAFIFYNKALRYLPASQTSVFLNCVPVVTILAARFMLREYLTSMQLLGAAVVIAGVLLANSELTFIRPVEKVFRGR